MYIYKIHFLILVLKSYTVVLISFDKTKTKKNQSNLNSGYDVQEFFVGIKGPKPLLFPP